MWPGFPWTDGETCVLGQQERKEEVFHHLGDHLTAGLGLLQPQPALGAGGNEGCPTAWRPHNLPVRPYSTVDLHVIQEIDCPGSSAPHVRQQQLSYLCSTPKTVRCSDTGVLGRPRGMCSAQREAPALPGKVFLDPAPTGALLGFTWGSTVRRGMEEALPETAWS